MEFQRQIAMQDATFRTSKENSRRKNAQWKAARHQLGLWSFARRTGTAPDKKRKNPLTVVVENLGKVLAPAV
jgi:hypothetical protein